MKNKDIIKLKFNIQESEKVKKFLGVYYEWDCGAKGSYGKMTMDKDVYKWWKATRSILGVTSRLKNHRVLLVCLQVNYYLQVLTSFQSLLYIPSSPSGRQCKDIL